MPTRSISAARKSSSPFIERRVISAICSFSPAKAAISSSVSDVTMVLSMSASSSRLRRPAAGVAMTSTGAPSSAVGGDGDRLLGGQPVEGDVGGFLGREPVRRAGIGAERLQRGAGAEQVRLAEPARGGDQGEDLGHAAPGMAKRAA